MKRARINRRRYSEVIAALKGVISDAKTPVDRRLRAVDTLLSVYDRADKAAERRAREAVRTDVPEAGVPVSAEPTQDAAPELTAEQQAEQFLEKMRRKVYTDAE